MKQTWWSRRAIGLHVVIIIIVPTFAALCIWQVHRALDGNELSWAYVFEWPFFAGYAIYMWWRFLHEAPGAGPTAQPGDATGPHGPRRSASHGGARRRCARRRWPMPRRPSGPPTTTTSPSLATRGKRKQWR